MNVFESRTLMACMSCLLLLQTAQAQPPATGPEVLPDPTVNAPLIADAPGQAVAGNYFGYTEVDRAFEPLLRVDARGGRLMGQDGFTRISAFMPYYLEPDALLFADVGAMALYNPSGGANLQVGWRWFVDDLDRIFGFNAGYDYDPGHNRDYNQFTFGFESLGRYVDYRANGYVPFGNKSNVLASDLSGVVNFNVNQILLGRVRSVESAMTGFDAEVGGPIPLLGRYGVSTYLGMYYFDGSDTGNVTGFSSRTQGQINEDLTVGVQVSHDSVFQTDVQMQVTWTIPDGAPGRWMRQPRVRDRLLAPVVRNYRVIAQNGTIVTGELAINPDDFEPFFVVHINPNLTPGTGSGTFEDPFSELDQFDTMAGKAGVDIAYVTAREDGTSTQLNTGVTLLNNQRFLSTAVPHTITAVQGTLDLPGFIGGPLPIVSNDAGGNVITFATGHRNIEVSGFEIDGSATGNGIFGIGNQRALINRNVITDGLNGVRLVNLSGVGAGAAGRSLIDQNDFVDNFGDGFSVINTLAAPLEIFITDNTATGNIGSGFRLQADLGSSIGGQILGNSTEDTGIGTSNVNNGLALFTEGGTIDFFNVANDWRIGGTDAADVNSFSDNGNFGINVIAMAGGDTSLRVINNDVSRNSLNGFGMFANSGDHVLATGGNDPALGNRIENNGLNGILLDLTGNSVTNLNIQNNLISQNGAGGIGGGGGGSGPVSLYDIDVVFLGGLSASQQAIFAIAAARWESIIIGDVPDVGAIDDIQITAEGVPIDGAGNVLGQAAPTGFRPVSFLPFEGLMEFDTADLAEFESRGELDEIVLHEMGHVIGCGTIWQQLNLLTGAGTSDPQFTGANALREYNAAFGLTATSVPVEGSMGPGSNDSHWRESVFNNELMTPVLNSGEPNPISRVTIGMWEDVGYQVDYNQADPYPITSNRLSVPVGSVSAQDLVIAPSSAAPAFTGSLVDPGPAIGDGINISVTDAAVLSPSTILDNTITQNARHGIYVTTNDGGVVPNLQIRRNDITNNGTGTIGSGVFLDRFESSTLNVTMDSNTVNDNLGDGLTANSQGIAFGGVTINSFDNFYNSNNGNGVNLQAADTADILFTSDRDTMNENTLNGGNALSEDGSDIMLNLHNITASNNTLDGFNMLAADTSVMTVLVDSPVDPLFMGTSSIFNSNDQHGLQAVSEEFAQFTLTIDDSRLQSNAADGINIGRHDKSLMQATVTDVIATGNSSDGLEFLYDGAYFTDPEQPLAGTPNTLDVANSSFNSNTGNGMHINGHADALLLANVLTSAFSGNSQAGVRVNTSEDSTFGMGPDVVDPFRPITRSTFDNITVSSNVNNGMQFDINSTLPIGSQQWVEINADSGNTLISDNTGDGIEINANGSVTDILIQGDTDPAAPEFTTQISNNSGDGVEINVGAFISSLLTDYTEVVIRDVTIGGTTAALGNGGDGIDVNNNGIGAVIQVGSAGDTTLIQNNDGDGISFAQDGASTPDRISGIITNTLIFDNDGHGVSMVSDGVLSEVFADSRYFLSLTDSQIRRSGLNGVNIVLNAHHLANVFTIDNNTIANNGSRGADIFTTNGVFVQLNAQDTLKTDGNLFDQVLTVDTGTWAPPVPGVSPVSPSLTGLPNYNAPYLNLSTALQARLNFTRNVVASNGNDSISAGEGLHLRISTNSQLDADVGGSSTTPAMGNTFTGNTLTDFRTASFLATASGRGTGGAAGTVLVPPNGIDGDPDTIYLDDTAQLDLRFKNNTGTDLNPSLLQSERAFYTNSDPAKGTNNTFRPVDIFQVDGTAALIDSTNVFTLPGSPGLQESDIFAVGNYRIRSIEDPLFPNPAFPQDFAADPFDPWLD